MSETGKVVVLTGVTRGLGRAAARKFAELGHRVIGCGRSPKPLCELAGEIGDAHLLRSVDVTDPVAVEKWAEEALAEYGAPDLILNNAALINRRAPLWQVPADEFSTVIDVNIKGVVNVVRAFVPAMIRRHEAEGNGGVIVNFSSGWGQITSPDVAPYCATKFAMEGLTGAFAQELPAGMAAVPFSPGIIHTEMLDEAFGEEAASYRGPEEWAAEAVPYLLGIGPEQNGQSLRLPDW